MVIPKEILEACQDKIPVIVGPTASGKTAFAIQLALMKNGEIISIDSRQVYKGFSIGTSQPRPEELKSVKHYLIDCIDPEEVVSAGKYCRWVWELIDDIKNKHKLPVLAGGTLLYIKSICNGIINEADSSGKIREKLENRLKTEGADQLLKELREIDPVYTELVNLNDHKKLIRALEIHSLTKSPPSQLFSIQQQKDSHLRSRFYLIRLHLSRDQIKLNIQARTREMIDGNWIGEVRELLASGVNENCHSMQGLGYKQMKDVLAGNMTLPEAEQQIATKTWQYARKQLTWLNKMDIDFTIDLEEMAHA